MPFLAVVSHAETFLCSGNSDKLGNKTPRRAAGGFRRTRLTSVLSADSSGKHLIIGHLSGALGWIGSGRLHPLPHGGLAVKAAW